MQRFPTLQSTAGKHPQGISVLLGCDAASLGDWRPFSILPRNVSSGRQAAMGQHIYLNQSGVQVPDQLNAVIKSPALWPHTSPLQTPKCLVRWQSLPQYVRRRATEPENRISATTWRDMPVATLSCSHAKERQSSKKQKCPYLLVGKCSKSLLHKRLKPRSSNSPSPEVKTTSNNNIKHEQTKSL